MGVTTFFSSFLVSILSLFLAGSAFVERTIVESLAHFGYEPGIVRYEAPRHTPTIEHEDVHTEEPSVLPSIYERQEYGGAIPKILLNAPQSAAIVLTPVTEGEVQGTTTVPRKRDVTVRDALVNVFCTLRTGNELKGTTGSGVFIDPRGVILTNAHVAQFLLLADKDRGVSAKCTIRTGAPARAAYEADLLYISPSWVNENADELRSDTPSGTGERDYALLYVNRALEGEIPDVFPALPYNTQPLETGIKNSAVIAAGFPAEILKSDSQAELQPRIATTTITDVFTFTKRTIDLIGIAPSSVGEGGSSGGPIVSLDGTVIGVISTRGDEARDGKKSLRAITLPYIDRTLRAETGVSLADYLRDNLPERALAFRATLQPLLGTMVRDALTQ